MSEHLVFLGRNLDEAIKLMSGRHASNKVDLTREIALLYNAKLWLDEYTEPKQPDESTRRRSHAIAGHVEARYATKIVDIWDSSEQEAKQPDDCAAALESLKAVRSCIETYMSERAARELKRRLDRIENYINAFGTSGDVVPVQALEYRKCDGEYYISAERLDDIRRLG